MQAQFHAWFVFLGWYDNKNFELYQFALHSGSLFYVIDFILSWKDFKIPLNQYLNGSCRILELSADSTLKFQNIGILRFKKKCVRKSQLNSEQQMISAWKFKQIRNQEVQESFLNILFFSPPIFISRSLGLLRP